MLPRAVVVGSLVGGLCFAVACHGDGGVPTPLSPGGDVKDDGHGLLSSAGARVSLGDGDGSAGQTADDTAAADRTDGEYTAYGGDVYGGYGGTMYGGAMYGFGGDPYGGGIAYGGPGWHQAQPHPIKYQVQEGMSGSVEGTVTWAGAAPPRIATACGTIDNPSLRVTNHAVGGALVYIENPKVGRATPATYGTPPQVGGTIAKHGCALLPAAQIVAPLPAAFTVHGDHARATLKITPPNATAATTVELQEAGMVSMDTETGVTRVDSSDGKLSSAWLVGLETPYFAITDDNGRYSIAELADGDYDLTIWQAPVAVAGAGGAISYGAPIVVKRKVHVAGGKAARLDVAIR
nr:hypothetical protein [Kofleriaceae bacterium]